MQESSSAATERVGRYQILDTIGSGPNGTVSRAKVFGVAGFERQFAVKRFSPELTVQTAHAQALSAAARAYGGLEHPRIARMSEFGVAGGTTFTAVEHVAGLDAMRLLTETKLAGVALAIGGALALVSQAARAVGYAHGRGLSHLGLSPTNVIVTIDGDVKVTDFGILAATMAPRPVDEPRLAQRIAYLAPEQLVAEATSAATDVFVLGVIACELVTGQRTYRGDTPKQIADAILAGPPPEPPLPRPIVRVIQRCLARSPFERFPDARALADALDAALRVAPVPGTRKDIGAQVKAIVDRLGELNEGNLSGMLSVNMPAQQAARRDMDTQPSGQPIFRGHMDTEPSPTIGPAQLAAHAAASTIPEIPKSMTTMPGLAPPPIPVPPGVMTGGSPPPSPTGSPTMMGVAAVKRQIPSVPSQIPSIVKPGGPKLPPVGPPRAVDKAVEAITNLEPSTEIGPEMIEAVNDAPSTSAPPPALFTPERSRTPTPGQSFDSRTGEMSQKQIKELNRRAIAPSGEFPPIATPQEVQTTPAAPVLVEPAAAAAAGSPPPSPFSAPPASPPPSPQMTLLGAPPPSLPVRNTPAPAPVPPAVADLFANTPQPTDADTPATQDFFTPPPQEPPQPPMFAPPPSDFAPPPSDFAPPPSDFTPPPSDFTPPPSDFAPPPQAYTPAMYTPPPTDYAPPPAYPPPPGSTLPSSPPPPAYRSVKRASTAQVRKSKWPWLLFFVLLLGGIGTGGYFVYLQLNPEQPTNKVVMGNGSAGSSATGSGSAQVVATAPADAAEVATPPPAVDAAAVVAKTPVDAAEVAAAPVDAGKAVAMPAGTSDALEISSAPNGAHVYLDGADQGKTPVKLPGTADRHNVALLLAGHDLYVGEIDGHGKFNLELKAITPQAGPAGIKVIKCKDKERYYVFVDGKPTGMTCPTERINTGVGPHTVEVYDAVSESRQKWDINVKDTRLSFRVRIEEH